MARKATEKSRRANSPNDGGAWRAKRGDANDRARAVRNRFRSQGRRFSDSVDLIREDRDSD